MTNVAIQHKSPAGIQAENARGCAALQQSFQPIEADKVSGPYKTIEQFGSAAGLVICVLGAIFLAMMNFALPFSNSISQAAMSLGGSELGALNALWTITLVGGFILTGLYTGYLLTRNHTWNSYLLPRTGLFLFIGLGMAVLWYAGVLFYGWGAKSMGRTGTVIVWPLFVAILILASTVCEFVSGERKEPAPKQND